MEYIHITTISAIASLDHSIEHSVAIKNAYRAFEVMSF
jgi:hypothetical protein